MAAPIHIVSALPSRPRSTDARLGAIDTRLDHMSGELRAMLMVVTRIAARLDKGFEL